MEPKTSITTESTYPQIITEHDWQDEELRTIAFRTIDLVRMVQGTYEAAEGVE